VLQSDVPGEQTSPTQPIPSKPAPYAHQGLQESDLIDYTPEIKAAALKLAQRCRMGPYFIPPSANDGKSQFPCSWYAPGASGGVNIDGGASADPETGVIYVAAQSGLSTATVGKDPCSEFRYTSVHDSCGLPGAMPAPAGYKKPGTPEGGFERRAGGTTIGGISIVKPKEMGGITAYDMKTGDKAWWIPNGGVFLPQTSTDPLFKGVKLPEVGYSRGQPQVMTTKTLTIYGTGRSGGAPKVEPQLYAVDKTTGKQIAGVKIPEKTSAPPMTFMHKGKQYIVFAIGRESDTALVALSLPEKGKTGTAGGQ
jgi:glucose dehydrogenase